ncbi:EamA family transporter [Streptomyces sp. 8N114]|uniref:EamA family transporter n=1 Tax=Streptomyces sp. 8N114 TaxID=3457419 RepID=UPI003FD5185A
MTPIVVAAVLAAALIHATWNALAHGIRDQLLAFTLVGGGGSLCGAVLACFVPLPAAGAWLPLLVSAALHVVYQALLMRSFRMGEFGQMYPIARGTAPLVVTVLAAVFVHEMPDHWQLAGVLLASAGLVGVALWGLRGKGRSGAGPQWPALTAAVCTGLAIAAYTVVDGVGVRASGTSLGYIAWLMLLEGLAIPVWAIATRRRELAAQLRPIALRGLLGGALSVLAYGLVLWAQTLAPLAPVAALRESSIIAGAAIGAVFFKERFGWPRTAASVLMVGGIALMLHGS